MNIQDRYIINPGTIDRVAAFKEFLGADKFDAILQGVDMIDIPLEQDRYTELLMICLDDPYFKTAGTPDMHRVSKIPYNDAEEIISFFCKPFAGRFLKQMKFTLDGISSVLRQLDPGTLQTLMESGRFPTQNPIITDLSSLQTAASAKGKESIN